MKHRAKKIYLEGYLYRGYVIQRRQEDYVYWSIGETVDHLGNYKEPTEKSDFYSVHWHDAADTLRDAKYLIDTSSAYCGDNS
tara:strand:+ start:59 stop:304 length:246 start_codon:yes stop_codon:yes gene_type:complete